MIYIIGPSALLMLFLYHIYYSCCGNNIEPEEILDPIVEYINKNKAAFIKTYENDKNMSENIEPVFYKKKDYTKYMKTDNNEIEIAWKTRILYENTPKGSIVMFYDAYKQAFTYYTDQSSMPITILNAVAMKYVMRFFCRDFYHDEQTLKVKKEVIVKEEKEENEEEEDKEEEEEEFIKNTYISPLIKIHNENEESEDKKKLKNLLDAAPFARLKSNKTLSKDNLKKEKSMKVVKDKNVNKFVSLGKMYNFHILQKKISRANPNSNTKYDDMFRTSKAHIINTKMSYKDFKRSKGD